MIIPQFERIRAVANTPKSEVIHVQVRHFHQMNHRCRAGVDWRHCGVVAKALVGLWVWAQWWWAGECPSAGWGRHAGPSRVKVMRLPAQMW
jgi:hypothetical protein